ncbi:hypothetical protein ACCUM_4319 [Candidatus Accumulibacter phosphatis]|uniref:Uncharacterized protein n=1 Tax=Candidatus Accumulibacter phosphatis TaxID=327160 RepID=A0A5S4EM89_9PROT|nr:hypothetical protein ACCUM_4319 [Candidatus Accumulibacter phosphatis]
MCKSFASCPVVGACSTPFGIKDDGTSYTSGKGGDGLVCSTPFGIKDDGTLS